MHISDGILPAGICLISDAAAIGLVYYCGKNLKSEEIPKIGIFTAAFFIISLIHFPLAGTSIHLGLYGLAGILFRKRSIPIVFITLLFQTLIFQHGGFISIGINTLIMSSGAIIGWILYLILPLNQNIKAFLCGFFGIALPAFLVSLLFYLLNYGKGMIFLLSVYLPAAIIEGMLTYATIILLTKIKPEILK